jgi:hypothetical protein
MARKRRVKPGNLHDLQRVLWATILEVEALLDVRPCSTDVVLRAAHALSQVAATYTRLTETAVLEERLAKLEASVAAGSER